MSLPTRLSSGAIDSSSAIALSSKNLPVRRISSPNLLPNALVKHIEQGNFKRVTHESFMDHIRELMKTHKAVEKKWHNNNSTIKQKAFIIDMKNLHSEPEEIIKHLGALKEKYKDETIVAVPVAGWGHKPISILDNKKDRLEKEYAQSFSLAALTTAKNAAAEKASIVLRASKESQKLKILKDQNLLRVSAGVRITDIDQFLLDHGYALPPNMPTLHVASFVGAAANGCYGPARDHASMTTNIVEMKIINAKGEHLTLSETENPELFQVLRDGHLGICFVKEVTVKIVPKFLMESHNMLFKDVEALKARMEKENLIDKEHFIAMYIPVGINAAADDHAARVRITNIERSDRPFEAIDTQDQKELYDYLNLQLTEIGEPIIDLVTKHPKLRKYWPFLLESAASKTFGKENETFQVGNSANILHIFGTYTDLPIRDINWLIQVDDAEDAKKLFLGLLELTEKRLIELGNEKQYPILNAFARYLKGICYPEGKGGIAATAVEKEGQHILSFELVTYSPLAETQAYKDLEAEVTAFLDKSGRKYNFHPGKNMPDNIRKLTDIIKETDVLGRQRIENFREATYKLHAFKDSKNPLEEGRANVQYSPFLTPQKKVFLGVNFSMLEEKEVHKNVDKGYGAEHEKLVVKTILTLANEENHEAVVKKASKHLTKLGG